MAVNEALKTYMQSRRSIPAAQLGPPGPSRAEIESMLAIAARVPDHGKLAPWRFIVYAGAVRERLGERLLELARRHNRDLSEAMAEIERTRLTRAPVAVAVVSRAAPHPKIPEWEQVLSAGAACMNLLIAANAHGYAANWLTEWMTFDAEAAAILGVAAEERIAGIIHVGTPQQPPFERARPDLAAITTWFESET